MPPTVHFSGGFESNDFSNWSRTLEVGDGNSIVTSTNYPKVGTYGAKVDLEDTAPGDKARLEKDDCMNVGSGEYIFASGWFFFPTGFNVVDTVYLFNIYEGSDAYKNILIGLNSSEQLFVNNQAATEEYTQASPIAVPTNQQCGIEIEVYVHNTEGYIKLRQDGVVIINATGKDTLSTGTWKDVLFGATYTLAGETCIFYFDEVYIQDEQKIWATHKRTINDSVGVTDSISRQVAFARSISDDVGVTDNLSRKVSFIRSIADNVGVTDELTRVVSFIRSIADSVGITDALARVQTHRRTISDSVGVTDTISRKVSYVRKIADAIGITDVLSYFHHYAGRFFKETPPTTTWTKQTPTETEWTKQEPTETDWTKDDI